MTTRRAFLRGVAAAAAGAALLRRAGAAESAAKPNIVLIIADDVGYGDLGCYGAPEVKTPNLDRLAREGVRCTDAHAPAAVCTPTRYALLTGRYAWRSERGDHILDGDAPLAIEPGRPTIPSVLKGAGYATGLVGKWHLGLGTPETPVDYNGDVKPGPLEVGFDEAFYMPATGDRVPCVYVENHRVAGLDPADPIRIDYKNPVGDEPTGLSHPELLKIKADPQHSKTIVNGISRIGYMAGGHAARWVDEDMADVFAARAVAFIEKHQAAPFFLYFSPHDIHEPMVPNPRFRGTSGCGWRGDVIHQLDAAVGRVLDTLDRHGLAENTLIVFSSDNGGAIKDTYDDGTNALHAKQPPNAPWRGHKGQLFEGGHRVPLLARWPGRIRAGAECAHLLGLVDLMAVFAAAAGMETLPDDAGPDSFDVLPALARPELKRLYRDHLVAQAYNKKLLSLRRGPWKLIAPEGKKPELYNLHDDPGEEKDLAKKAPDKVAEMKEELERIKAAGRTRP